MDFEVDKRYKLRASGRRYHVIEVRADTVKVRFEGDRVDVETDRAALENATLDESPPKPPTMPPFGWPFI